MYLPHEIRQLASISEFTVDLRHVKELKNAAADALSRIGAVIAHSQPFDYETLAAAQLEDYYLQCLRLTTTFLRFTDIELPKLQLLLSVTFPPDILRHCGDQSSNVSAL